MSQSGGKFSRSLSASSPGSITHQGWDIQSSELRNTEVSCTNTSLVSLVSSVEACDSSCICQCHKPLVVSIANLVFNSVLGRTPPRIQCGELTCKQLQKIRFSMLGSIKWISVEIWIEGQSLTHVSLRMPRVVGRNDLDWLEWATLDDVRKKLSTRKLTVNDILPDGESVLHVSASSYMFHDARLTFLIAQFT